MQSIIEAVSSASKKGVDYHGVVLTRHAISRMRKRCGINKRAVQRVADRAYENGMDVNNAKGYLKKWLKYRSNSYGNEIRIFGDKAFVFNGNILITVFQIPSKCTVCRDMRQKITNPQVPRSVPSQEIESLA